MFLKPDCYESQAFSIPFTHNRTYSKCGLRPDMLSCAAYFSAVEDAQYNRPDYAAKASSAWKHDTSNRA